MMRPWFSPGYLDSPTLRSGEAPVFRSSQGHDHPVAPATQPVRLKGGNPNVHISSQSYTLESTGIYLWSATPRRLHPKAETGSTRCGASSPRSPPGTIF